MKLLRRYVLIKKSDTNITKSGIILNDKKENKNQGVIQELGPECDKNLKKGQTVLYKDIEGYQFNILNDDCLIIDSDDIIAICE